MLKPKGAPMVPNKIVKPPTTRRSKRESGLTRILRTVAALIMLFVVALPKDLLRWLRLTRKCVRGQTIVITGGGSGLGKRLVELFSAPESHGARVAIIDQNLEAAESVVQSIRRETNGLATVKAWRCDISDAEAMSVCADEIRREFGRVDIVVCNAAVLHFALAMDLRAQDIKRALEINVFGTINTIRAFLGPMEAENRGHIVSIASIAGHFGETFGLAYCPTKFAVRGAMDCLRMELHDRGLDGIHCTTICPFFIRTPMILNKGIRPKSRWIPFMSINSCAQMVVDAILKEKVVAFMPPWISVFPILSSFFSVNMQRVSRDWLDFRYEQDDIVVEPLPEKSAFSENNENGDGSDSNNTTLLYRPATQNGDHLLRQVLVAAENRTQVENNIKGATTNTAGTEWEYMPAAISQNGGFLPVPIHSNHSDQTVKLRNAEQSINTPLSNTTIESTEAGSSSEESESTSSSSTPSSTTASSSSDQPVFLSSPSSELLPVPIPPLSLQAPPLKPPRAAAALLPRMLRMEDRFEWAGPFWYALIPPAMLFTLVTYMRPEWIHLEALCFVGDFAYYMGTQQSLAMLLINIFAWFVHLGEAVYALWICDELRLTHLCSLKWATQTFALGYPSLRLLLRQRRGQKNR